MTAGIPGLILVQVKGEPRLGEHPETIGLAVDDGQPVTVGDGDPNRRIIVLTNNPDDVADLVGEEDGPVAGETRKTVELDADHLDPHSHVLLAPFDPGGFELGPMTILVGRNVADTNALERGDVVEESGDGQNPPVPIRETLAAGDLKGVAGDDEGMLERTPLFGGEAEIGVAEEEEEPDQVLVSGQKAGEGGLKKSFQLGPELEPFRETVKWPHLIILLR